MTNLKAIDLLDNLLGMIDDNQGNDYDKAIHMAIEALSAERKGHWIMKEITVGFPDWFCSECGTSGRGDYQYCPWCRANMR